MERSSRIWPHLKRPIRRNNMDGYDEQDIRLKKLREGFILDYKTREPETWELSPNVARKMKSSRKKKK
jgi:hypothetical protein